MWRIILIILTVLIIIAGGVFAWTYVNTDIPELVIDDSLSKAEQVKVVDQWLEDLQASRKFNGQVLIAKGGNTSIMKAYGFMDHTKEDRLTTQSSMRLASVTKQFTCTGIMLLAKEGLLSYDDDVQTIWPQFPYDGVTIRHLMTHTSGVPDMYMDKAESLKDIYGDTLSISDVRDMVIAYSQDPDYLPGAKESYNNTAYVLLAAIIQSKSGLSYEDYLQANLFAPLQMQHTRVWNLLSDTPGFEGKAADISSTGKIDLSPTWIDGVAGDGAIFSCVEDFLIWDQFWYSDELLTQEEKQEAFQSYILNDGTSTDYGFGWVVQGDHVMWHNGGWLGARTMIARNTETKRLLVVLDNSSNPMLDDIVRELKKFEP